MIRNTEIHGLFVIENKTFEDDRGFFRETFRMSELTDALGKPFNIEQENHSHTLHGNLRGIHVAPWNKLVYVPKGEVQAVIVDTRPDSPTLGRWQSFNMGDENRIKLFVPAGTGNALLALSNEVEYLYQVDQTWFPNSEKEIKWNDSDLAIQWQIDQPKVSERDSQAPSYREYLQSLTSYPVLV